jgi:hypothetical protein
MAGERLFYKMEPRKKKQSVRFLGYWVENIKQAKDGFDIAMLIGAAFFGILCVVSPFVGFPKEAEDLFPEGRITWFFGIAAATFFLVWCFIWLPFVRHERTEKSFETEIENLKILDGGFMIKASAIFRPPDSICVEVVNHGQKKIIIRTLEATFQDGEIESKNPKLIKTDTGGLALTTFDLIQKGDIEYIDGVDRYFVKTPKSLVLVDTLGNRYPVTNFEKATLELKKPR